MALGVTAAEAEALREVEEAERALEMAELNLFLVTAPSQRHLRVVAPVEPDRASKAD
jgi:hypothetical protein